MLRTNMHAVVGQSHDSGNSGLASVNALDGSVDLEHATLIQLDHRHRCLHVHV